MTDDDFSDLIGGTDHRSEHAILNDVLMQCSALPRTFIYRQNTGQAWQGRPVDVPVGEYVRVTPGMKILAEARPISFGLPGAGDAVGHRNGKAFQIETKTLNGQQRVDQQKFQRQWEQRGGLYILARDPADAVNQLTRKR